MSSKGNNARRLVFTIPFGGEPDKEELDVTAYAFDRRGRFLTSAPVDVDKGETRLSLTDEQARHVRLFFAPTPPEERQPDEPTLAHMERWRAYEPVWEFDPEQRKYELFPIPELHWHFWPWCFCRVRGRVVRPIEVGGVDYEMPVCNARVHICEVDRIPRLLLRLPDRDILRLRDDLIPLLERPIPIPPRPQPDPPPIDPPRPMAAGVNLADEVAFNPQPDPPVEMPALPYELRANLASNSVTVLRHAFIDHVELIYPLLCRLDWLWYKIRCDELTVVTTDEQGRFDTWIWYLCTGDHPDLYLWVEYCIEGVWTTVYRPLISCSTYWDYECGSEVTLRVTDSRVPWCGPAPRVAGNQIAVLTIGEDVSVPEIEPPSAGAARGLTIGGRPFGGSLEPRVFFGEDLIANGVTHYRWRYRKVADSDNNSVSDSWHDMERQVVRHYGYTLPDGRLKFKPYFLGPDTDADLTVTGLNLFEIQPEDPPDGAWSPEISARENAASAFFRTAALEDHNPQLAAGKYEMLLEMFDKDGNRIMFRSADGTTENVRPMIPVQPAPFGPGEVDTVDAPAEYLVTDGAGNVIGFRLIVHVDNNPCQSELYPVALSGGEAGPCGFLNYDTDTQPVTLHFYAYHENDYATFSFKVRRGTAGIVEDTGGRVGQDIDGYVEVAGDYSKDVNVNYLLRSLAPGDPGCIQAAFAETLKVRAMATDGYHRQSGLDAPLRVAAFALAPETGDGD